MDNSEQKRVNPLLEKLHMPGETFRLPSGGIFYEGKGVLSPDVKNGEVHVMPMTAYDEIIIKTPDKLFSGSAVIDVFTRCIPDIVAPDKLLSKDVDFLMLCLRKMSYGNEVEIEFDHKCENSKKHSYMCDVSGLIRTTKNIDPTKYELSFTIPFENGQTAYLRPINFMDYINIMQTFDMSLGEVEAKKQFIDSITCVIDRIDDISDKDLIGEWVDAVPRQFIQKINESIEHSSDWGPEFQFNTVCKDCGANIVLAPPLNPISFFI